MSPLMSRVPVRGSTIAAILLALGCGLPAMAAEATTPVTPDKPDDADATATADAMGCDWGFCDTAAIATMHHGSPWFELSSASPAASGGLIERWFENLISTAKPPLADQASAATAVPTAVRQEAVASSVAEAVVDLVGIESKPDKPADKH